jgi:hypothetical protein
VDFARRVFEPSHDVTLRITGLGPVDLRRSGMNMAVVWMVPKKLVLKTSRETSREGFTTFCFAVSLQIPALFTRTSSSLSATSWLLRQP